MERIVMRSVGGGASRLRQINREIVLHQLRSSGPLTKAALASATRLSLATCGNILADLLRTGEVVALAEKETAGGRPARVYTINPEHGLAAVIATERVGDREELTMAVTDGLGRVLCRESKKGKVTPALLDSGLRDARKRFPAIRTAAISVPGWIADGEIGSCDNPALAGVRLEERLCGNHDIEIAVENDMNLAALGYYTSRSDLTHASLVYFAFFPGCCSGAGVIVNGRLVGGRTGFAGEVSYIPLSAGRYEGKRLPRSKLVRQFAESVVATAALINPDVAVVSGGRTDGIRPEEIAAQCARLIPEKHVPELVVKPDPSGDRLSGGVAMALRMQSCEVGLVMKKRTWCDDE